MNEDINKKKIILVINNSRLFEQCVLSRTTELPLFVNSNICLMTEILRFNKAIFFLPEIAVALWFVSRIITYSMFELDRCCRD